MLAYQQALNDRREALLAEVLDKLPPESSALAQAIINAMSLT